MIVEWSASELSTAIHTRKVSCREVMQAYLARIEAKNPAVNAIVALRPAAELLAEAEERDNELEAGVDHGWMHGFPVAVKDLTSVKGLRGTMGCSLFENQIGTHDSLLVERMRNSGSIFIGRTNVPEFGLGSHTYNPVFGRSGNSADPSKSAGGSSGGAGVALALHMVPVADGSDMMGSLRNPAAWNGILGFRPSVGVVPGIDGGELFLNQLSTSGPMARNSEDLRRFFDVIAGPHPLAQRGVPSEALTRTDLPTKPKLGWLGDLGGYLTFETDLLQKSRDAAFNLDADVVEVPTPEFDWLALWDAWCALRSMSVAGLLNGLGISDQLEHLKPEAQWEYNRGVALSATDVLAASAVRTQWWRKVSALFKEYDFLVLPTTQVWPFPKEWDWPQNIGNRKMDTYHRWMEVTIYASMIGLPVISVPAGPQWVGIQIIAPKWNDSRLLELAKQLGF